MGLIETLITNVLSKFHLHICFFVNCINVGYLSIQLYYLLKFASDCIGKARINTIENMLKLATFAGTSHVDIFKQFANKLNVRAKIQ